MYMYVAMWYKLNHAGVACETAKCVCVAPTGIRDEIETLKNYNMLFLKTFSHMYNNLPVMHQFVPYTQAKTFRGQKDTLAPVFFIGGTIAPFAPPRIDATNHNLSLAQLHLRQLIVSMRVRLTQKD